MAEYEDTNSGRLDDTEHVFRRLVAKCSRKKVEPTEIDLNTSMRELGFESMDLVNLVVMIEDQFDILLPQELLLPRAFATPLSVLEILKDLLPSERALH
jgi:acyl carrier protein